MMYTYMIDTGRGRHAIVFECRDPSGRIYAMKLFKQDSRDRIRRELEIFQYLENGPNIIKFIDAVQGEEVRISAKAPS